MRPQEKDILDAGKNANQKYILIGEDDKDDEELLSELFDSVDPSYSLVFINNGEKVLTYLQNLTESLPCLILLDYNMPVLNGAQILQGLEKDDRYRSVPKVIWSTSTSESFRNICLNVGATDYIVKPSNVNELVETIRYMLSFC